MRTESQTARSPLTAGRPRIALLTASLIVVALACGCPDEKSAASGNEQIAEILVDVVDITDPGTGTDLLEPDDAQLNAIISHKYRLDLTAFDGKDIDALIQPHGNIITNVKYKWTNPTTLVTVASDNDATDEFENITTKATGTGSIQVVVDDPRITFANGFTGTFTFPLTVTNTPFVIELNPATGTIQVGQTLDVQLVVKDALGLPANLGISDEGTVGYPDPAILSDGDPDPLHFFGKSTTLHLKGNQAGTGRVHISARSPSTEHDYSFTVAPAIASVALSPSPGTVAVGATLDFSATPKDANGNSLSPSLTTFTWSVVNGALASVNSNGRVTGIAAGQTQVKATTSTGIVGQATLNVAAAGGTVATVTLSPATNSCLAGGTAQYSARAFDSQGAEVFGSTYRWLIDDSNVGSITSTTSAGVVTCNNLGTTNVRAFVGTGPSAPGTSGILNVVSATTATSLLVSPFHTQFTATGQTQPYTVTAYNAAGALITTPVVVWAATGTSVSVSVSGLVTANASGGGLITATAGTLVGAGAATVAPSGAIVATLVQNASATPIEGAQLKAFSGATQIGPTGVTNHNGRGYIPGLAAGTYTVTLSLNGYQTQTFTGIVVTAGGSAQLPSPITMQ